MLSREPPLTLCPWLPEGHPEINEEMSRGTGHALETSGQEGHRHFNHLRLCIGVRVHRVATYIAPLASPHDLEEGGSAGPIL